MSMNRVSYRYDGTSCCNFAVHLQYTYCESIVKKKNIMSLLNIA